jgi:hypothetical protein
VGTADVVAASAVGGTAVVGADVAVGRGGAAVELAVASALEPPVAGDGAEDEGPSPLPHPAKRTAGTTTSAARAHRALTRDLRPWP